MPHPKSDEERAQLIRQLRETLSDREEQFTDQYLEQFLIARSWAVTKAQEQLQNTLDWRETNHINLHPVSTADNKLSLLYPVRGFSTIADGNLTADESISESVLRVHKYLGGCCLHKTDNDGCPVYIERLGFHDAKGIAKNTTTEEVLGFHIGCNEFLHRVIMKDCTGMAKKTISRETVIFDCTGMGWHQLHTPALSYIRAISDLDQKYYPETLNKLYLVNAPSAFVYVWKIVKAWLDQGTIDKIQILGSDYKDTLLKHIPAANLPAFLGGQCQCEHMPGGCVPSSSKNSARVDINQVCDVVEAGPMNEKGTNASYHSDIMEKAKTSEALRGPPFYDRTKSNEHPHA